MTPLGPAGSRQRLIHAAQNIFIGRPVADCLSHLAPENLPVGQHNKHRRHGEILPFHRDTVGKRDPQIGIAEQGVRNAHFLSEAGGVVLGIDANRNNSNMFGFEFRVELGQLTQLACTEGSPITPVEDDHRRAFVEERCQANRLAVVIGQIELRGGGMRGNGWTSGAHVVFGGESARAGAKDKGEHDRDDARDLAPFGGRLGAG